MANWEQEYPEKSHLMESVTEPDQAYTIAQLLERHRQGILTDTQVLRDVQYTDSTLDDPDLEKLRDADIVDRHEYMQSIKDVIDEAKEKLKAKKAKEKEEEEKELSEFRKRKKEGFFSEEAKRDGAGPREPATKGPAPSEAGNAEK